MTLEKIVGGGVIVEEDLGQGRVGKVAGWNIIGSLNNGRNQHAAAEAGGLIYAIGGLQAQPSVEEYDPATDTWTEVASLNTPRIRHAAAGLDGSVYAIGGLNADTGNDLGSVEEYDPATDTWTEVASLSTPRRQLGATGVAGAIYAIGGSAAGVGLFNTVEQYDPATDTWTEVAPLPTAKARLGVASADTFSGTFVYAVGGDETPFTPTATVVEYNTDTDAWTGVASMNKSRSTHAVVGTDGPEGFTPDLYAIGAGEDNAEEVERYSVFNDEWTVVDPLNEARNALAGAEIDGNVYAIAGSNNSGILASVEELNFETVFEDVYTATGDALVGVDQSDAVLLNSTTGAEVTGGDLIARDGETIAAATPVRCRVFRTEER